MTRETLSALKRSLAGLDGPAGREAGLFSLGWPGLDEPLGGGLARGALHEVFGKPGGGSAALGFGLALALRGAGPRTLVWVRQDFVDREAGGLHGAGLAAFGADPDRLILVRAPDAVGALRAGDEAARCPSLGAALVELWGAPPSLDLTATRRLALAAGRSGVALVMLRLRAAPAPSAAATRWAVAAAPSTPLEANAPGRPAFAAALVRHRAGIAGRTWLVEWDRDRQAFDAAPLSRPLVPLPADRPAAADAPSWGRAA